MSEPTTAAEARWCPSEAAHASHPAGTPIEAWVSAWRHFTGDLRLVKPEVLAETFLAQLPAGWRLVGPQPPTDTAQTPSGPPRPRNRPMRGCPACTDRERA